MTRPAGAGRTPRCPASCSSARQRAQSRSRSPKRAAPSARGQRRRCLAAGAARLPPSARRRQVSWSSEAGRSRSAKGLPRVWKPPSPRRSPSTCQGRSRSAKGPPRVRQLPSPRRSPSTCQGRGPALRSPWAGRGRSARGHRRLWRLPPSHRPGASAGRARRCRARGPPCTSPTLPRCPWRPAQRRGGSGRSRPSLRLRRRAQLRRWAGPRS
mmetsp:Transcript_53144/g.166981  ORF Transcript_53144/g.166981 Transcript_53144/m.166981 type:complete len:212 (+) Transcript_53144:285-920(+)